MTYKVFFTGNFEENVKRSLELNPLSDSVSFYSVSLPTIQRWRSDNTKIPTWTTKTYSYYVGMLQSNEKLKFEQVAFSQFKRDLSNYFELEDKIKSFLDS